MSLKLGVDGVVSFLVAAALPCEDYLTDVSARYKRYTAAGRALKYAALRAISISSALKPTKSQNEFLKSGAAFLIFRRFRQNIFIFFSAGKGQMLVAVARSIECVHRSPSADSLATPESELIEYARTRLSWPIQRLPRRCGLAADLRRRKPLLMGRMAISI